MKTWKLQFLGLSACIALTATSIAAQNSVVIDFGDDYCWQGGVQGLPTYRAKQATLLFKGSKDGECPVDVDGDGQTDPDSMAYYEFSMDSPYNPTGAFYNHKGNSAKFYGGAVSFWAHRKPNWQEGGINLNHELRDDFNLHSYAVEGGKSAVRTFGVWLWKKEDFRNGGDKYPVSFDANSVIGVYISRYWKEYEEGRFVVQEGGKFYITEKTFGGKAHTLYTMKPSETLWAEYGLAAPYAIEFDPKKAKFEKKEFTDIQAAGWYIAKPTLGRASLWVKWYGFTMDAVVNRPATPSHLLKMKPIAGGGEMTERPVSYGEWREIYRWSNRNQYAIHESYIYDRDGDMGTMFTDDKPHTSSEPVTDITWLDAVAWCNALSEHEGLEPVFYSDAECKEVLRVVVNRQLSDKRDWRPEVFVKWNADGFRPATAAEMPQSAEGFFVVRSRGKQPADTAVAIEQWKKRFVPLSLETAAGDPGLKMISVPGGSYLRADDATIKINPFFMAETEITFDQWKKVYAWAVGKGYSFDRDGDLGSMDWSDLGTGFSQDEPATQMSHLDAMLWCNALSEMQGKTPVYYTDAETTQVFKVCRRFRMENPDKRMTQQRLPDLGVQDIFSRWDVDGYRLPSEWEWEYAYRAGNNQQKVYPWGKEPATDYAWIAENSGDKTQGVKQKKPNAWGLYDMAGNVFEWAIGKGASYYLVDNPRGEKAPAVGGGSFRTNAVESKKMMELGSGIRLPHESLVPFASPEIGFRVIRCEKDTHPKETPPYLPVKVLELDTTIFDTK